MGWDVERKMLLSSWHKEHCLRIKVVNRSLVTAIFISILLVQIHTSATTFEHIEQQLTAIIVAVAVIIRLVVEVVVVLVVVVIGSCS